MSGPSKSRSTTRTLEPGQFRRVSSGKRVQPNPTSSKRSICLRDEEDPINVQTTSPTVNRRLGLKRQLVSEAIQKQPTIDSSDSIVQEEDQEDDGASSNKPSKGVLATRGVTRNITLNALRDGKKALVIKFDPTAKCIVGP